MAKNPVKGFTMDQLEKSTKKAEKQMKKSAAILPQVEGPGNPDYESKDEQKFAGDDTYTYKKKDDSPLYSAYEQGAGGMVYASERDSFQNLFNTITQATNKLVDSKKTKKAKKEVKEEESLFKADGTLKKTFGEKYNKKNKLQTGKIDTSKYF